MEIVDEVWLSHDKGQPDAENNHMQEDFGTAGRSLSSGGRNHIKVAPLRLLSKVARRVCCHTRRLGVGGGGRCCGVVAGGKGLSARFYIVCVRAAGREVGFAGRRLSGARSRPGNLVLADCGRTQWDKQSCLSTGPWQEWVGVKMGIAV